MRAAICLFTYCILAAGVFESCTSTYEVNTKDELRQQSIRKGPIRALTIDSLLYSLDTFSFTDSLLTGIGTVEQRGLITSFKGSIPFDRIVFIEELKSSLWKTVTIVPIAGVVVAGLIAMTNTPDHFTITRPTGGSCPYIYAFSGKRFELQAEAFGTSISRALEARTFSVLPSLAAVNGRLSIRIGNLRPETHLLNSVHLFAADVRSGAEAVLDTDNRLWPLTHPVSPIRASDHSGNNILSDIIKKDGRYWRSDLGHTAAFSGFRDELELQFEVPPGASEATLVIHAINTDLITEAYRSVGAVLGNATMQFYYALEHDAELQSCIRGWISDCTLRIETSAGAEWIEAGMIKPEANVAPFSRSIRIKIPRGMHGPLRVRLSSLTDVWRIDAVAADFSPAQPIPLHPLKTVSVSASNRRDEERAIASADSSYALLLPGDHIDIAFDAKPAAGMQNPVFVSAAQGYLYEWFPTTATSAASFISETMTAHDRIAMLKLLIRQKDLFLPPIYENWRKVR